MNSSRSSGVAKRGAMRRGLDLHGGGGEALHEGGELVAAGVDGVAPRFLGRRAFLAASFSARRAAPIATYSWASSGVTKESALGRRAL